jgi:hypothetical protein
VPVLAAVLVAGEPPGPAVLVAATVLPTPAPPEPVELAVVENKPPNLSSLTTTEEQAVNRTAARAPTRRYLEFKLRIMGNSSREEEVTTAFSTV